MARSPVSVIIPVYNGERFIAAAVRSALAQTRPAFEIIVVNDGSRDGTLKELAFFGDKVKVLTIPNGGPSHARNVGIRASRGEYLAFLDADDVWMDRKLEIQMGLFAAFPKAGLSCCNFTWMGRDFYAMWAWNKEVNQGGPYKPAPFLNIMRYNYVGTTSVVVVKRAVLDEVGVFNEQYQQSEDYDLWLRCAMVTGFIVIPELLADKKVHATNLTGNLLETNTCHERVLMDFREKNRSYLKANGWWQASAQALAAKRYDVGNCHYDAGAAGKAWSSFARGLVTSWTPRNAAGFLAVSLRKLVRTLTGGLVSRKNLQGLPKW